MIDRLTTFRSDVNSDTYFRGDKTRIIAHDSPHSGMRYYVRRTKFKPVRDYHQSQRCTGKRPSTSDLYGNKRRKENDNTSSTPSHQFGHKSWSITSHRSERKNAHKLEDTTSFDEFKIFTSSLPTFRTEIS